MIDVTGIKSPGWAQVVEELSAAASDDSVFFDRLLRVLCRVSAARQGVLFIAQRAEGEEAEPRAVNVWPRGGVDGMEGAAEGAPQGVAVRRGPLPAIELEDDVRSAARSALTGAQSRAFGLERSDPYYGTGTQGYVLALPVGSTPSGPAAVVTLLVEQRSKEAVRWTLAMAEVLAGYVHAHAAHSLARRTQQGSIAFDLATRLVASINMATGFKGAVMQLANDVARQLGADRAAVGWVKGDTVRVRAISDTEHFDRRMAMVQKLEAAMDECLDQEQAVVHPQPTADEDVMLSQAIAHAHRELASSDARLRVASVPLRVDEEVVGVLTLEWSGESRPHAGVDLSTVELAQSAMDLVAPVLRIRRSDDRVLASRAWGSVLRGASWVVGAKHTAWKLAALILFAASLFVVFYRTTYRVSCEAVLEPRIKRVVSSPYDGVLMEIGDGVRPGGRVSMGAVLFRLDDTEWRLSAEDAKAKILTAEKQAQAARQKGDPKESERYELQARQGRAELAAHQHRIERSVVTSPIDGVVVNGDLEPRLGSTVTRGTALLEVASLEDMVVVARVDERDIGLATGHPQGRGEIATKAYPDRRFAFIVERVVPMASAEEGKNVFEVRGRLEGGAEWMRPGMEGLAKLDTDEHSLLWIGTRRIVETVRLWLW